MKQILLILAAVLTLSCKCQTSYPEMIHIDGGKFHVQGIALDKKNDCMYCSFTSAFYKTNLQGVITGSVTGINGHLGAMTFDPKNRKVYASLEIKNDAIGKGISDGLGAKRHDDSQSGFYIAEIEVDKISGFDVPFEDVVKLHPVEEALKDYMSEVEVCGKTLKHRYGCSGIDGITIGPAFGSRSNKTTHLYVAYGIYRDTTRCDNDYNILLCYDLKNLQKPEHKYFVYTGNTTYGVQNMTYDAHTARMYLAVYPGVKSEFPNYNLFALDMKQSPRKAELKGVDYMDDTVEQLEVCKGWHFKWGSTGLCAFGDGRYYISQNGKGENGQYCKATLYTYSDSEEAPFALPCED